MWVCCYIMCGAGLVLLHVPIPYLPIRVVCPSRSGTVLLLISGSQRYSNWVSYYHNSYIFQMALVVLYDYWAVILSYTVGGLIFPRSIWTRRYSLCLWQLLWVLIPSARVTHLALKKVSQLQCLLRFLACLLQSFLLSCGSLFSLEMQKSKCFSDQRGTRASCLSKAQCWGASYRTSQTCSAQESCGGNLMKMQIMVQEVWSGDEITLFLTCF